MSETALDTYLLPSNDVELKNVEYFVSIPEPSNTHDYLGYLVDLPHSVFVSCLNSPNKVKLVKITKGSFDVKSWSCFVYISVTHSSVMI